MISYFTKNCNGVFHKDQKNILAIYNNDSLPEIGKAVILSYAIVSNIFKVTL